MYIAEHRVIISDEAVDTNSLHSALQVVEISSGFFFLRCLRVCFVEQEAGRASSRLHRPFCFRHTFLNLLPAVYRTKQRFFSALSTHVAQVIVNHDATV